MIGSVHQAAWIAALAFVVALFALTAIKNSQPRFSEQEQHTSAQGGTSDSQQHDSNSGVAENTKYPADQNREGPEHSKSEKESTDAALALYTYYLTFFTAVLAAGTIILAIATIGLWGYAAEQASDMKESIAETRRSSNAAQLSAQVAREALVSTQRAVIVTVQTWTFPIGTPVIGYSFHVSFKNAGPTTAKTTRILSRLQYFDRPFPEDHDYTFDPPAEELEKSLRRAGDIGRDTPFDSSPQGLSMEQIENIRAGKATATYQYYVLYNDVFDGTPLHRTAATIQLKVIRDPDPKILLGGGVGTTNAGLFNPEIRWSASD